MDWSGLEWTKWTRVDLVPIRFMGLGWRNFTVALVLVVVILVVGAVVRLPAAV